MEGKTYKMHWRWVQKGWGACRRLCGAELSGETGRFDLAESRAGESPQLGCLFPWLEWSSGSQGMSAEFRGWDKEIDWRKEV